MVSIQPDKMLIPKLIKIKKIPKGVSTFSGTTHELNLFLKSFTYPKVIE